MNITTVELGYIGLSNAVLLAQHNHASILEFSLKKVELINKKIG